MLRIAGPTSAVPAWQIVTSLLILAGSGTLALLVAARIFRIGMLMYGKTPTLPEILRWARQ
jgi:ABC-2 type transport system permease protein